jgi:hypothetical protein
LIACALALSALCWLAGCQAAPVVTQPGKGDPIVGEFQEKGFAAPPPPPGGGKAPAKAQTTGLPALPEATASGSNTGVLVGAQHTLAIDSDNRQPVPTFNTQPAGDPLTSSLGGGVQLQKPQPLVQPLPRADGTQTQTQTQAYSSPSVSGDYDDLQARLKRRNVIWQRQETYGDGFKFSCGVQVSTNPNRERNYEAVARDYRSAILAVLEQLE